MVKDLSYLCVVGTIPGGFSWSSRQPADDKAKTCHRRVRVGQSRAMSMLDPLDICLLKRFPGMRPTLGWKIRITEASSGVAGLFHYYFYSVQKKNEHKQHLFLPNFLSWRKEFRTLQAGTWLEPGSGLSLKHLLPPIHARLVFDVFTPVAHITQILVLGDENQSEGSERNRFHRNPQISE